MKKFLSVLMLSVFSFIIGLSGSVFATELKAPTIIVRDSSGKAIIQNGSSGAYSSRSEGGSSSPSRETITIEDEDVPL